LCPKNKIFDKITIILKGSKTQSVPLRYYLTKCPPDENSSLRCCWNQHSWDMFESPSDSQPSVIFGFAMKMVELLAGGIMPTIA